MKTKYALIDAKEPDEAILAEAAAAIIKGQVVVCPTDTGYAFCANATDVNAISRIYRLKVRPSKNPIHIAVKDINEAARYAVVDDTARFLAKKYLPGALTLVMKKRENIPGLLVSGLDTVGIRIPDNPAIQRLTALAGLPLTTTSANISGQPGTYSVSEIEEQVGTVMNDIAYVLDQGPIHSREVSTIIDISVKPAQLIRQGKISWLDIHEELKRFDTVE